MALRACADWLVRALHGDAFGPDDDGRLAVDRRVGLVVDRRTEAGVERRAHRRTVARLQHVGVEDVGGAQESGDERGGRRRVDLLGRADLLDATLGQDGDLVAHGERFLLVVGDVDERDADLALQGAQLQLQLLAQLGVQRAERLVEQQHPRAQHQCPRQRDPLLLAAGQLGGAPFGEFAHPGQFQRFADAPLGVLAGTSSGTSARTRRCPTPS